MDPTDCPPDDIGGTERVRYFEGMLLGVSDFEQEQTYFRTRLRRHNRLLHGWGIVGGLEVTPVGSRGQVSVAPGFALDPCGNEVIIGSPVIVNLPSEGDLYLGVRFEECVVGEARVRDSFAVQFLSDLSEPWILLAKVNVDDQGTPAIDSSLRRPLSLDATTS